uniref:Aspartyl protease n=1 Tax=Curvibacter symbiont subsp. Hydra magnipapillata TaxID=667019 RepID=C9YDN8_CURXX|nr:hypothetical protein Csp_F37350 [Curvibacter putative symbiont of Hydra magnipapillata]
MGPQDRDGDAAAPRQIGLIPLIVFWCVVMGLLYAGMSVYLQPKKAQVLANGDLIIPRALDGHFYTTGRIQGVEVTFLVDTGASLVTVSEAFARKAGLTGGTPTTFRTANGDRPGRVVEGASLSIGPVDARNIKIGVGLHGGEDDEALLGQSFLSKFDITLNKDHMVLKPR